MSATDRLLNHPGSLRSGLWPPGCVTVWCASVSDRVAVDPLSPVHSTFLARGGAAGGLPQCVSV